MRHSASMSKHTDFFEHKVVVTLIDSKDKSPLMICYQFISEMRLKWAFTGWMRDITNFYFD